MSLHRTEFTTPYTLKRLLAVTHDAAIVLLLESLGLFVNEIAFPDEIGASNVRDMMQDTWFMSQGKPLYAGVR
jgi:hypothetical protein